MSANVHPDEVIAGHKGSSHQLLCSRRASDAVRARAAELNTSCARVLEQVIKLGLEAIAHYHSAVSPCGEISKAKYARKVDRLPDEEPT